MRLLYSIFVVSFVIFVFGDDSSSSSNSEVPSTSEQDIRSILFSSDGSLDTEELINRLAEGLSKERLNITLVAWQDIHDDNGNLKEIRTLELVIPPKKQPEQDDAYIDFDKNSYDDLLGEIEYAQEQLEPLLELGFDTTMTKELYDEEFEELYQIVAGKNLLYASRGGFASMFNETINNASPEEIEAFIKAHHQRHTYDTAVLRYDEDGKFIPEKSNIVTPLIVTVNGIQDSAPVRIVDKVVEVVGKVAAAHLDGDISQPLYEKLGEDIPEYVWDVIENPDEFYVSRDFGLFVTYDPIEIDYRNEYYIYGNKK